MRIRVYLFHVQAGEQYAWVSVLPEIERNCMSETTLVRCCAPTLAGLKTGSLFNCRYEQKEKLLYEVADLNRELLPRGLRILPLRFFGQRVLLYLYRPDKLARDLEQKQAQPILMEAGYENSDCAMCIRRLISRLHADEEFPHEVGLFLGYPPEDVRGFIENRAHNYKLAGDWKVYGDADHARQVFEQYKKCTQCYCRALDAGITIRQLAVAI